MMSRRKSQNTRGTITTTFPIPHIMVGGTITLPSCTKEYFDWDDQTWKDAQIDSGTYWVLSKRRVIRFSGDPLSDQKSLDVYDEVELAEYYG
jgi:hypothetical protein